MIYIKNMMNIKVQNKFMGNIMETHMKIIGLGGFANVGKTTFLKSLIKGLNEKQRKVLNELLSFREKIAFLIDNQKNSRNV